MTKGFGRFWTRWPGCGPVSTPFSWTTEVRTGLEGHLAGLGPNFLPDLKLLEPRLLPRALLVANHALKPGAPDFLYQARLL